MGNCFGLCRERPETYATMVASESVTAEPSIAGVEEEVLAGQTFGVRAEPSIQNEEAEDLEFISHSFICNDDVVRVLQTMKVMFIMRGAPGSGKSSLADAIQRRYPSSVLCSADHFWLTPEGEYKFEASRLKEAHKTCQNAAYRACHAGQLQVIIDNTNTRRWEFKYYTDLANRCGYFVIFAEPQTPWRHDAETLFSLCRHSVPLQAILMKVQSFEALPVPLYFGWFLTPASGGELKARAHAALSVLQSQPQLLQDVQLPPDVDNAFTWTGPALHVTSKFCDRGRLPEGITYCARALPHVPKAFALRVFAFLITPRVVGAAVGPLEEDALQLWDNGDQEGLPRGAKAHVTLGTASGVRPMQAGPDLLLLLQRLREGRMSRLADWSSGELWSSEQPGEGCLLQLKQPLWLDTVFGHFM